MKNLSLKFKMYLGFLLIAAFSLLGFLWFIESRVFFLYWKDILIFGLLVFLSEQFAIDLPTRATISVSATIILAAAFSLGPLVAALATFFAVISWNDIKDRVPLYRVLFNFSQFLLSAGLAGLVYLKSGGFILIERGLKLTDFPFIFIPLLLASATYFLLNTGLTSFAIGFLEDISPLNVWLFNYKWMMPNYFMLAILAIVLAQVYAGTGVFAVVLLFAPLIIARETFQVFMKQRRAYAETIAALAKTLEAKDAYTAGHSERVSKFAELVARELKLREDRVEFVKYAALLHDIGKVGISKRILNKPGRLTDEEFAKIQEHPEIGANILKEVEFLKNIVPGVFHHHEHYNGNGYRGGLKGEEIPLEARIIAVVDCFDAMMSNRPYRKSYSKKAVLKELKFCCGTQFDETIVEALFKVLSVEKSEYPLIETDEKVKEENEEK